MKKRMTEAQRESEHIDDMAAYAKSIGKPVVTNSEKCPQCGGDVLATVCRKTALEEVPAMTCARNCGWHEQRGLFLEEQLTAQAQQIADLRAERSDDASEYGQEIGKLTARAELADAACAAMREIAQCEYDRYMGDPSTKTGFGNPSIGWAIVTRLKDDILDKPHPGHALAARLAELERLDAAAKDNLLARRVACECAARYGSTPYHAESIMAEYRAELAAAKESPDAK